MAVNASLGINLRKPKLITSLSFYGLYRSNDETTDTVAHTVPYHEDSFLRNMIHTAVDIPGIQTSLRDRIPSTWDQAQIRISNRLSEKLRTAVSTAYNLTVSHEV